MAEKEENDDQPEVIWEDRTLNLLQHPATDHEISGKPKPGKKLRMKQMKHPTTIPQLILDLLREECRETAFRALSNYLVEKREEDPENYHRTGFLLFYSCATLTLLLQEILTFYGKMTSGCLNVRCSKRFVNVVTLFQSIAANIEVRGKFVNTGVPNFLIPIILFKREDEVFESIRSICLSVVGILCQPRESNVIQWAHENNMIEVCQVSLQIGHELSKVVTMHILEALLHHTQEKCTVCSLMMDYKLRNMLHTLNDIVSTLALGQISSPRLLWHILRCYVLLCTHPPGTVIAKQYLPCSFIDGSFSKITEKFPLIRQLLSQLLLYIGLRVQSPVQQRNEGSFRFKNCETINSNFPIF